MLIIDLSLATLGGFKAANGDTAMSNHTILYALAAMPILALLGLMAAVAYDTRKIIKEMDDEYHHTPDQGQ